MGNEFIMSPTSSVNPLNAQNLASEMLKKFPNMTPKNPADTLNTEIKEEVKEDFARAQEVALKTEEGKKALQEFESVKKHIVDELITQTPKGAEALKTYREKVMSIYKENEANKVELATKATDELNAKYKSLQSDYNTIKAKLDEVLKRIGTNENKVNIPPSPMFTPNR